MRTSHGIWLCAYLVAPSLGRPLLGCYGLLIQCRHLLVDIAYLVIEVMCTEGHKAFESICLGM